MEQIINIELLKQNNEVLLTNLPIQAKNELVNFYQYIYFKYNIVFPEKILAKEKKLRKSDFSFYKSLKLTKNNESNLSDFIINERRNEKW